MNLITTILTVCLISSGLAAARAADPAFQQAVEDHFRGRMFRSPAGESLPYRLFVPPGYDGHSSYPLVLKLEATGAQGNDLENPPWPPWGSPFLAEPVQDQHPCFLLTPRCLAGDRWFALRMSSSTPPPITRSLRLTTELLDDVLRRYRIDRDRVYVFGFSMGGLGAWDLVTRYPEKFAAAIPISGIGNPRLAKRIIRLPLWAFHGQADPVVPVTGSRSMIQAIQRLGGQPRYSEYPGTGHGDVLGHVESEPGVLDWLFSQKRKPSPAARPKG